MRFLCQLNIQRRGLLLGLSLGAGLLVWVAMQVSVAEDVPGAHALNAEDSSVPPAFAAIHEKLHRKVEVNFQKATLEQIRSSLAKSLGASIEIDMAEIEEQQNAAHFDLVIAEPVTIKTAIPLMMQRAGAYGFYMTLHRDGVRLVGPEAAQGEYVLQTLDLRGTSRYTTLLRREFISQAKGKITPNAWEKDDGPWIAPAASVFALDVYHTPEAFEDIAATWNKQYVNNGWVNELLPYMSKPLDIDGEKHPPEELAERASALRKQYPLQSLADRLKYEEGRAVGGEPPLTPAAAARLDEQETTTEFTTQQGFFNLRRQSLKQLHSDEVAKFVAREGFGLSRMPSPSPSQLPAPPVPRLVLPSQRIDPPDNDVLVRIPASAAEPVTLGAALPTRQELTKLHTDGANAFVSPERLGYIKSRDEVAGFASHAFTRLPRLVDGDVWYHEPTEQWVMRRLELVSLLKHKSPRVYVSDSLPQLEDLAEVETRDLTPFEHRALTKLEAGEDMMTEATLNRIEMFGSLRAAKNCLECHDVKRGQLLGAFSYTLVRDPLVQLEEPSREEEPSR